MAEVDIKIDTSRFAAAMVRFAANSKKTSEEILRHQAQLFIRDAIRITPPGKAANGSAVLVADLTRIFRPVPDEAIHAFRATNGGDTKTDLFGHAGVKALGEVSEKVLTLAEMHAFHQERRTKRGRVMKVNRNARTGLKKKDLKGLDVGIVAIRDFKAYVASQKKLIGKLASGWAAAAQSLGIRLSPWISRHGTSRGAIKISTQNQTISIRMENAVPFAPDVRGLQRRVQWALNNRAKQMDKQVDNFAIRRAARASGL